MTPILHLRDAILTKLRGEPNWTVYDGEPPAQVPADAAGRALTYACLYLAPATADPTTGDLAADHAMRVLTFGVTVASGTTTAALNAVDKADRALLGWLDGHGIVRRDPPGPVRVDRDVSPPRWYLPLTYRVDLTD